MSSLTPQELQVWLEWAGARLIAMPSNGLRPAGAKVLWPEYSQEIFQVIEFRKGMKIRAPVPDAEDITLLEEILILPSLCGRIPVRRTVRLRTLIHPVNERHIYSWQKIAFMLGADRKTVFRWYNSGLSEIIDRINPVQIARLVMKFRDNIPT